ncbi:MAG: hypothetical protein GX242_03605 [Clostridiales bacterium]|nr:hypothetical protein [Clostridiales bacterium]
MYCENCRVKIDGKTTVCPLCHKQIVNTHDKPAFPVPNPKQTASSRFLPIFSIIFVVVMAVSIALNVYYYKSYSYPWSLIVFFALFYIGFFIKRTILAQSHFRQRLIGQTLFLTIIAFVVRLVTSKFDWIFISVLPTIYIVSIILLVTRMIKYSKYAKKNIISSYILGFMGLIPIITAYAFDLSMKIPAFIASGLSAMLVIVVTIIFRKLIILEIRKFFHL